MVSLKLYNVFIPKHIVEDHYPGGIVAFRTDFPEEKQAEDEYMCCLYGKNATDIRPFIDQLTRNGIHFDPRKNESDQFTVLAKEGLWWKSPWLIHNYRDAWFIADVEAPV